MYLKTETEAVSYVKEQIMLHRREEIVFCGEMPALFLQKLYQSMIEAQPQLLLCIENIDLNSICLGRWNQYTVKVEYSRVFPAFVSVAANPVDAKESLLASVAAHRKTDFLVCRESQLEVILEAVKNIVNLPEYLNCFLREVRTTVVRRREVKYCGIEVTLLYSCDYKTARARKLQTDCKIAEIVNMAQRAGTEDLEKAFAVVCYCVEHWSYRLDQEGLGFTAYGALVQNEAVCMGFSLALCAVFPKIGIPCKYICGRRGKEGHAWNMVYVRGGWFYIDITDAIGRRDPRYHWGVTEFEDGRTIATVHEECLVGPLHSQ